MSSDADIPAIKNKRIVLFGEIVVDEGSKCVFEPWMSREHNVFGWDARAAEISGRVMVYVAPDIHTDGPNPEFYLYIGPHGDPNKDRRLGPYTINQEDADGPAS